MWYSSGLAPMKHIISSSLGKNTGETSLWRMHYFISFYVIWNVRNFWGRGQMYRKRKHAYIVKCVISWPSASCVWGSHWPTVSATHLDWTSGSHRNLCSWRHSRIFSVSRVATKRVVGSTAILETRAVVKLACLVPQPLLSSNYYTEQVWRICLTLSENAAKGLPVMYCSMFSFCHSRWLKSCNLTPQTYMLWHNRITPQLLHVFNIN